MHVVETEPEVAVGPAVFGAPGLEVYLQPAPVNPVARGRHAPYGFFPFFGRRDGEIRKFVGRILQVEVFSVTPQDVFLMVYSFVFLGNR